MARAQSVISEIVTHLERQGLLEREGDPADRQRTLIWLTPSGHEALRHDREVLSVDHLPRTMARPPPGRADDLIAGFRTLVAWPPQCHKNGRPHPTNDLERG
jgi:hypothetical protein